MDKFKEMEKAMEERVRQLETRVENIDKRHDQSQPAPLPSDRLAFEPEPEVPVLSVHVKALEICSEEILEHMLPHIDAILAEMERRVPAIYLPPLAPPATGEAAQMPSATAEAAETTPAKRNKPTKRNRRPLSGNFTSMSVADTPLSPSNSHSPPLLPTQLSPTSVTFAASQSSPRAASNGNAYTPTPTTGQNPIQSAPVTSTSKSPLLHNNTDFATVPRSSAVSAGRQSISQVTVTTASTKSTNGITLSHTSPGSSVNPREAFGTLHDTPGRGPPKQTPLKNGTYVITREGSVPPKQARLFKSDTGGATSKLPQNSSSNKAVLSPEVSRGDSSKIPSQPAAVTSNASVGGMKAYNSTQAVYSTNTNGQTALTTTTVNPSSYGNTNPFVSPHAGSIGQPLQMPTSQTPPRIAAPSTGLPTPATTKPPQVGIQVGQVNTPRIPTAPTPSHSTTSAANTITQLSSIANVISTPSVKTTSTGAIPRLVAAPVYSGWLEPLQPQLTESALTAQHLANVRKSIPAAPNGTGYPQTSTLAASNLGMSTTERQTVSSTIVAAAVAAAIARASTPANSPSVSGSDHFGNQASLFTEPSPVAQRPVPPSSSSILQPGAQQPTPNSSLSTALPGAQQPTTSSHLSLQPETAPLPGPTASLSLQSPIPAIQTNPFAAASTLTTTTRPSILKDESSASRPHPATQDPFAQPKQVRFAVPPSPTTDHPLVDVRDEPLSTVEAESGEPAAFAGPLSFAEATDLLKNSAISGHEADVRRALDAGASIDAADAHGQRALHWAAWCDHARILEVLVRRGAELELRNDLGMTPLHMAARGGSAQCVAFLLDAGVGVDARANNRRTALHLAAAKGCDAVVQVLLASGADKSLLDGEGMSAFDLAITDDIRELLIY